MSSRLTTLNERRQVRRRRRQVAHRRAQLLHRRQRGARERADLVADDRRRLAQERPRLLQRRRRARAPPAAASSSVGPSSFGQRRRPCRASSASSAASPAASAGSAAATRPGRPASSNTALEFCTKFAELRVALAELVGQQREVVHDAREVARGARASPSLISRAYFAVGSSRRIACASSRPLRSEPEALRAVVEQQQQVVARVGVQRREDLVEVDVGQRLRDRDHAALLQPPGVLGARA